MYRSILKLSVFYVVLSIWSACDSAAIKLEHELENAQCASSTYGATKQYSEYDEQVISNFSTYLIEMDVEGQKLGFVADTGSSNVVTMGQGVSGCSSDSPLGQLDTSSLDASSSTGTTTLAYGSGSGTATTHSANIGLKCESQELKHKLFALTSSNNLCTNILGLAYPALTTPPGGKTFFDSLVEQNSDLQNLFSLTLCGINNDNSYIELGWYDHRLSQSDISNFNWTNIEPDATSGTRNYYWVAPQNLSFGTDGSVELKSPSPQIVDSGTTLLQLPESFYADVVSHLQSNYSSILPDSSSGWWSANPNDAQPLNLSASDLNSKLPSIYVTLPRSSGSGTFDVEIKAAQYLKKVSGDKRMFGVQAAGSPAIFGQPFLESASISFDRNNNQMGFFSSDDLCNPSKS